MRFRSGDRVRIRNPQSEYTGCRGTIADGDADSTGENPNVTALGHRVAIDGENGIARPFLIGELELLRAARVEPRPPSALQRDAEGD